MNYDNSQSTPNQEHSLPYCKDMESYLRHFPRCLIQSFDDSKKRSDKTLTSVFEYDLNTIQEFQEQGAGIFCAINPTTEGKRDIQHLQHISALMLDLDVCKEEEKKTPAEIEDLKLELLQCLERISLKPHFVIETKNGFQAIWLFEPFEDYGSSQEANELYKAIVKGMGEIIGTSSEGDNVIRVFRVPFTQHLKNPQEPFLVKILEDNSDLPRYKFSDFIEKYAVKKEEDSKSTTSQDNLFQPRKITDLPLERVIVDAAKEKGITVTFKEQSNGTKTIVENGQVTSGFISQDGKFAHSMSGKARKGRHISIVQHYLGCDEKEAQKRLRKTYNLEQPFYASHIAKNILQIRDFAQVSKTYFSTNDGVWMEIAEESVKQEIIDTMDAENMPHSPSRINQVINYVDIYAYKQHGENLEKVMLDSHKTMGNIVFSNGILDLQSFQLRPIKKEDYIITRLSFPYENRPYNCPRWRQFLDEIFATDSDKSERIDFIQEWIGYTLVADTSQQVALILIGEGANGKSALLSTWQELIGGKNYITVDLADIANDQYTAELMGKLLNVGADVKSETQLDTGIFKKLVAGEQVMGKSVYKRPIKFTNYARLVFATNDMPYLKDGGEAIRRRLHILSFNRRFTEKDRDINLKGKLILELPDILLWALEGLKRLKARGHFMPPQSVVDAVDSYLYESNSVALFVEECCDLTKNDADKTLRTALYQEYQKFCKDNGYRALSSRKFFERLRRSGFQEKKSNGDRCFLAIKIKNNSNNSTFLGEEVSF